MKNNNQSTPKRNLANAEISAIFKKYGLQGGYFIVEPEEGTTHDIEILNYFTIAKKPLANQLALLLNVASSLRNAIFSKLNQSAKDN